jgi:hypothetical protein
MADISTDSLTTSGDAAAQTYQLALGAFRDWRASFAAHKAEEARYEQALATCQENPEKKMPDEYEGIENVEMLAQMNANRRAYLEGRFEGISQALSLVAGGDPMEWNIKIQNDTAA